MNLTIKKSGQACGASVTGVDLTQPLDEQTVMAIRQAWLEHHVLAFPDQDISDDDLERFTLYFGPFGEDPFIAPVDGRKHIIAVQRGADETSPIFAETWHTDWSFQATPPAGTCLYGITIPTTGGDTVFANQHKILQDMPADLRQRLDGLTAYHSAKLAYNKEGAYGEEDVQSRSMSIIPSDEANEIQTHPIIRAHPETGELAIFGAAGYIIGIQDMDAEQAESLMMELYEWQSQPQFEYRHQWQEKMLIMWDNRSLLHKATGGYEGQARYLHRTTIGERVTD